VCRNVRSALYTNEPSHSAQQNFIRNQHLLVPDPWVYVMPLTSLAVGNCGHGDAMYSHAL